MLTDEDIRAKIETFFAPFRCVAEFQDYRYRLGFAVSDQNNDQNAGKVGNSGQAYADQRSLRACYKKSGITCKMKAIY